MYRYEYMQDNFTIQLNFLPISYFVLLFRKWYYNVKVNCEERKWTRYFFLFVNNWLRAIWFLNFLGAKQNTHLVDWRRRVWLLSWPGLWAWKTISSINANWPSEYCRQRRPSFLLKRDCDTRWNRFLLTCLDTVDLGLKRVAAYFNFLSCSYSLKGTQAWDNFEFFLYLNQILICPW